MDEHCDVEQALLVRQCAPMPHVCGQHAQHEDLGRRITTNVVALQSCQSSNVVLAQSIKHAVLPFIYIESQVTGVTKTAAICYAVFASRALQSLNSCSWRA